MPTTIQALAIVVIVLAPGFVFAKVAGDVIAFARQDGDLHILLPTITCGIAVHLVLSEWTIHLFEYYRNDALTDHLGQLVLWGLSLVFVVPVVLGVGIGRLSNSRPVDQLLDKIGLGYIDRMPSAWDYMVRLERSGFMRVNLKSGRVVGGTFYNQSFASTTPGRSDLYLEQAWRLDDAGNFVEPLPDTQGRFIAHEAIDYIEFFTEGESEALRREQQA